MSSHTCSTTCEKSFINANNVVGVVIILFFPLAVSSGHQSSMKPSLTFLEGFSNVLPDEI